KPARCQHRCVGCTEQNAVPGDDAQILGQHVRDLVRGIEEVAIAPARSFVQKYGCVPTFRGDRGVEELGRAVEPGGVGQVGECGIVHVGPQFPWREIVGTKRVDVSAALAHLVSCVGAELTGAPYGARSWFAITSCWISLVPS